MNHYKRKIYYLLPQWRTARIVDTGYLDAKLLLTSRQDYHVDLLGPTRPDYRWQAPNKESFAAADFHIDRQPLLWQKQQVTCPEGKISTSESTAVIRYGQETVKIKFLQKDCIACPGWSKCTRCGTLQQQGELLLYETARHHFIGGKRAKKNRRIQNRMCQGSGH